ncbi:helix-turn-helix domain-containing protein [Kitasatospora sp. NPDC057500]|uniref:helix-turn-helix domain-containing protein n=1 Tax=Kitasatospora sp. NPDC057500 TaxID=3346151 RepID=UPI0036C49075
MTTLTLVRPLNYAELAEYLGIEESWLRRRIKRLPHQKYGREVRFSADDIEAIRRMHTHTPAPVAPNGLPGALVPRKAGRTAG